MSSEYPAELHYTKEHEWVRVEGDIATIGITEFAQSSLGDVVFVELPSEGDALEQNETFGSVEAVKAVSDLFSPITGEVAASNEAIDEDPSVVNQSPYGDGWMIKVKLANPAEIDGLLSADAYSEFVAGLEEGD